MTNSSSLLPDKPDNGNPDCGGPGSAGTHTLTNLRHSTDSLRFLRNCSSGARGRRGSTVRPGPRRGWGASRRARTWLYPTSGIHQRSRNLYRSKCSKASRRATRKPCTARRTRQLHQQQHSCNSPAAALASSNPCLAAFRLWGVYFCIFVFAGNGDLETGMVREALSWWLTELPPTRRSTRGANSLQCIPPES